MNKLMLVGTVLAAFGLPATAATISLTAPAVSSGAFDLVVQASNLFVGRNPSTDAIISYGFNVSISDPAFLSFTGATSGPLFDPAKTAPGTAVFASASGLGISPPVATTITLATLHFNLTRAAPERIVITSDPSNVFQGLQYLNAPVQESIAGTVSINAVPEPATLLLAGAAILIAVAVRGLKD